MDPSVAAAPSPAVSAAHEPNVRRSRPKRRKRSHAIDKSVLAMSEPRRLRDRDHVRSVAQHPCLICGRGRRIRTISGSRKTEHSAARSATNSPFRSAAVIIAKSIGAAMKRSGGGMLVSTRPWQPAHSGSKTTRCEVVWKIRPRTCNDGRSPIDGAAKSLAYLEHRRTLNNGSHAAEPSRPT